MKHLPKVSIVVPAYDEADQIDRCLQTLTAQDYAGPLQIIVVDNASTDDTAKIAKMYKVKLISEDHPGVALARRAGFASANGDIILSTDADTWVPKDWVSRYVAYFSDAQIQAVSGRFIYHDARHFREKLGAVITPIGFRIDSLIGGHFSGCNFGIRADAYKKCGGFDTRLLYGEDYELSVRLHSQGYKIATAADIVVQTSARQFRLRFWKVLLNLLWLSTFKRPLID